jgi:steroid delta-isomerase-like uncharacterized protein
MSDALFDAWEAAWSGRDPGAFAPLCLPDVHYEDPVTPEPLVGVEPLVAHAQRLWKAFPDARLQSTGERLYGGSFVAAPCKVLATHTEELEGLAPTNKFIIVHAVVYAEVRDGKLFRARTFFDLYDAAVQLGVLPKPGTLGERALLLLRGFGITRR